ncbi:MAG TPA: tetratricopeptide repeat protein, partial [Bacteroidetes bacterium]|nr:tetratricopeptide repeat protein [Bacteroidota bacterium]
MKMLQGSRVQGMITIGVLSVLLSGAGGLFGQAGNGAGSSYFDLDKAIATNEELIRKYPDSEFAASVMAQLMELHYRKATEDYQRRMAKYEEDLDAFERGIIKSEPIIPRVSYREAMSIGYKLLEKYPTAPFIDRVLYRLAISHQQENTEDKAALYLDRLVREYPDSPYIEEANFRLGEFYFNKRDYRRAIEAYSKLLRKYDSPYFNMALYKLGWAYYSINDYARSIGTFVYLIDDLDRAEKAGADIEGKSSANLRTEAISYIAECFAELGGAAKAQKFIKDFGEKDYSKEV